MKKQYIKPKIRIVSIHHQDIICASYNYLDIGGEGGEDEPAPPPPYFM